MYCKKCGKNTISKQAILKNNPLKGSRKETRYYCSICNDFICTNYSSINLKKVTDKAYDNRRIEETNKALADKNNKYL